MNSKGFSLIETVIFIILAALAIPIFYLTTAPMIKEMMTPTSYIKARFVAEKKMEELMAYRFADSTLNVGNVGTSAVNTDTAFSATLIAKEYASYQWQWAISYLDCGGGAGCVGYTGNVLTYTTNPTAKYKEIDVTVTGPQGYTYRAVSAVTARY